MKLLEVRDEGQRSIKLKDSFLKAQLFFYHAKTLYLAHTSLLTGEYNIQVFFFFSFLFFFLFFSSSRMDSFVLAETFKYLFLLFAEDEDLVLDVDNYLLTTEAHILPLSISKLKMDTSASSNGVRNRPSPWPCMRVQLYKSLYQSTYQSYKVSSFPSWNLKWCTIFMLLFHSIYVCSSCFIPCIVISIGVFVPQPVAGKQNKSPLLD